MHEKGFHACSIQDITDAASVPKGSFYNHFSSKENFALACLGQFWERGEKRRDILKDLSLCPCQRIDQHFSVLSQAIAAQNYQTGCMFGNFSTENAHIEILRDRLHGAFDEWSRLLAKCIEEAQQQNKLDAQLNPLDTANFLVNAWEGAVLRCKVERTERPLIQFQAILKQLLKPI